MPDTMSNTTKLLERYFYLAATHVMYTLKKKSVHAPELQPRAEVFVVCCRSHEVDVTVTKIGMHEWISQRHEFSHKSR